MSADEWLRLWWLPLAVTVVGGLILAGLLAIPLKPVREKFWKPIGRAIRWPFTLRLTTTRRQAVLRDELDRLQWEVVATGREGDRRAVTAELVGHKRGREEALAEVEAARSTPLLRPVWRVVPFDAVEFLLHSTQKGITVSDVSIAADPEDFEFRGDSQWPGPFEETQRFVGTVRRRGRTRGFKFTLRWRDANGDWQTGEAWIDKEPVRAVVL